MNQTKEQVIKNFYLSIALLAYPLWFGCDLIGQRDIGSKNINVLTQEIRNYQESGLLYKAIRLGQYVGLKSNLSKAERNTH